MGDNNLFILQKKIGYIFFIIGLAVSIFNLIYISTARSVTVAESLVNPSVLMLFILSFYLLITTFINNKFIRLSQIFLILFAAGIAILDAYNSIHGIGLIFLAILISFKYRFFERQPIFVFICFGIYTFAMMEISASKSPQYGFLILGIESLAYLALMVLIVYIIYRDEIRSYLERQKRYSNEIQRLLDLREILQKRIDEDQKELVHLNKRIHTYEYQNRAIDFVKFGITKTEEKVIEILCTYRCSNKEIADRLDIAVPTVKVHVSHIMDKLGVDDRFAIIDICKNNYIVNLT